MSQESEKPTIKAVPPLSAAPEAPEAAEAPKTLKLAEAFERDDYDGDIDVNNLPAVPWTQELLGEALFKKLAIVAGVGDLQDHQRNPSLDPRSFGRSRAIRLVRLYGLKGEQAQAYMDEGEALQEAIDAKLDPVKGTPRNPKAKPLRPARTKFKESGPGPKMWS